MLMSGLYIYMYRRVPPIHIPKPNRYIYNYAELGMLCSGAYSPLKLLGF